MTEPFRLPNHAKGAGRRPTFLEDAPSEELIALRDTAVEAAIASARAVMNEYNGTSLPDSAVQWKKDATKVTKADVAGDIALVAVIRSRFPEDDIFAEESGHHEGLVDLTRKQGAKRTWHCDSNDGTRPFSEGKLEFTTGIQVEDENGNYLVAAAVHSGRRQLYYAIKGFGAYMMQLDENLSPIGEVQPLEVSKATSLHKGTAAIDSFYRDFPQDPARSNITRKDEAKRIIRELAKNDAGETIFSFDEIGSNISTQIDVARGSTVIGFTDCKGGDWDWKVGQALIMEAKGDGYMIDAVTGKKPTSGTEVFLYGPKPLVEKVQPKIGPLYIGYRFK